MYFGKLNLAVTVYSFVIFGNLVDLTRSSNPGLKLRISEGGLNYAATVALDVLSGKVRDAIIPDQTGRAQTPVGKVDYEITGTTIKHFSSSSTSVTVNPGAGLTWQLRNLEVSIRGNWRYNYKRGFIRIRDHGSFDGSISQSRLDVSVTIGLDGSSGRPTIRSVACDCQIDGIGIQLHGGASWLYNLFIGQLERPLRGFVQEIVCEKARKAVDENGGSELATWRPVIQVADRWLFDCSLVSPPLFQSGSVEFFMRGEFRHEDVENSDLPFTSEPFELADASHMVNIGISEYVLNTVTYALYRQGIFSHNLKAADLQPAERYFLNTSCSGLCVGRIVSAIGRTCPNAAIELEMVASGPPQMEISVRGVRCRASFSAIFRARLANESLVYLMSTNISATVGMTVALNGSVLRGNLTGFLPSIAVTDSAVGPVTDSVLQTVFKIASRVFIVPKLNKVLQRGVPLAQLEKIELNNSGMEAKERYLQVLTDIRYTP